MVETPKLALVAKPPGILVRWSSPVFVSPPHHLLSRWQFLRELHLQLGRKNKASKACKWPQLREQSVPEALDAPVQKLLSRSTFFRQGPRPETGAGARSVGRAGAWVRARRRPREVEDGYAGGVRAQQPSRDLPCLSEVVAPCSRCMPPAIGAQ